MTNQTKPTRDAEGAGKEQRFNSSSSIDSYLRKMKIQPNTKFDISLVIELLDGYAKSIAPAASSPSTAVDDLIGKWEKEEKDDHVWYGQDELTLIRQFITDLKSHAAKEGEK